MFFYVLLVTFARSRDVENPGQKQRFQQLPRDLANINALENNVCSLSLHSHFRPWSSIVIFTTVCRISQV